MKVEVDADELCELRSLVTLLEHSNKHKQVTIDSALSSIRNLSTQLTEAHAKNVDYSAACSEGLNQHISALKKERDWWRLQARSKAKTLDEYEASVCEEFQLVQPEGFDGHLNLLLTAARKRGYKVPE